MRKPVKRTWTVEQLLAQRERYDTFRTEREAARAKATRKAAGFHYIRGDLHMHTRYSDGSGTVDDVVEVARRRGLDFIFVTDHGTVRQKVECRKYENVWWGQEPGAGLHHICILGNRRKYPPCKDMARDAERLRKLGCFFFYPHPVGWYPTNWYPDEAKDALAEAGPQFAIEVINGIFRAQPFHDEWIDSNVALWDRYLCAGCRVTGLGATDSHSAPGVGNTWTGVLGADLTMESVIETLRKGRVFASMGPAVNLTCGRTPMGGVRRAGRRTALVRIRCADSRGLQWVRVVQGGRAVREFRCKGDVRFDRTFEVKLPRGDSYVRAECASVDDRRAYANPVYFRA